MLRRRIRYHSLPLTRRSRCEKILTGVSGAGKRRLGPGRQMTTAHNTYRRRSSRPRSSGASLMRPLGDLGRAKRNLKPAARGVRSAGNLRIQILLSSQASGGHSTNDKTLNLCILVACWTHRLQLSEPPIPAPSIESVSRSALSRCPWSHSPRARNSPQWLIIDYCRRGYPKLQTWYQTVIVRGYQRAEVWARGSLTARSWKRVGLVHVIYQDPDRGCAVTQRPPIMSHPVVYTHNLSPGLIFAGLIAHASL